MEISERQDAAVRMRHRSGDGRSRSLHRALLYRRDVVSNLRRRNDLLTAVGDYFHGQRFLVHEVCAGRNVHLYRNSGRRLLLRLAQRRVGVGVSEGMRAEG